MTTPAFSHTYTYSRVGVGDVIALDPAGEPYTITVTSVPSGWAASFWYATDSLASIHDLSKWTEFNPVGAVPTGAVRVAVNVEAAPRTPESARLKVNVGTSDYKAATGLRYTDSGGHDSALAGQASQIWLPPDLENLVYWFDFSDLNNAFRDEGGTIPAEHQQTLRRVNNKGIAGGFWSEATPISLSSHAEVALGGTLVGRSGADSLYGGEADLPHNMPFVFGNGPGFGFTWASTVKVEDSTIFDNAWSISRSGGTLGLTRVDGGDEEWTHAGSNPTFNMTSNADHPTVNDQWESCGIAGSNGGNFWNFQIGSATNEYLNNGGPHTFNGKEVLTTSPFQWLEMQGSVLEILVWRTNLGDKGLLPDYKAYIEGKTGQTFPFAGDP